MTLACPADLAEASFGNKFEIVADKVFDEFVVRSPELPRPKLMEPPSPPRVGVHLNPNILL